MQLRREHRQLPDGPNVLTDVYAVVGEEGAATIWWSDTRAILGHRVCAGVSLHSVTPRDDWTFSGEKVCEFTGGACWSILGSTMGVHTFFEELADKGDEAIYSYLAAEYLAGLVE
jgi:hypothetical protein